MSETNIRKCILEEVMESEPVLTQWEAVASSIPTKYKLYGIKVLEAIAELWITVRGHLFAKKWTSKLEKKFKKGTRKT